MTDPAGSASSPCSASPRRGIAGRTMNTSSAASAGSQATRASRPARCAARRLTSGLDQRFGLGQAAADQGHGEAAVRPVARADRGHHGADRRVQPGAAGDGVLLAHVLLWADPATQMQNMSMRGGWKRMMAGMPLIMMEAHGPGHIALSDNHAARFRAPAPARPVDLGQGHRFLTAPGTSATTGPERRLVRDRGQRRAGDALPDGAVRRRVHRHRPPRAAAAARAGQRVHPGPPAGPVAAHPAELADLPGLDRPGPPAPGVPAQPGLRVLAINFDYRNIFLRIVGPGRVAIQSISSGRRRWK